MARGRDYLRELLAGNPGERDMKGVELARVSARKLSQLFQNMDKDILDEVLSHVQVQYFGKDDIVIREGEIGDRFYLILHGKVSVYMEAKMTKKDTDSCATESVCDTNDDISRRETPRKRLNRDTFGKFITVLERGRHFGEVALLSEDGMRNASIISDEDTELLAFERSLYNRTVKIQQKFEFEQKQDFVDNHPFFSQWLNKCKHQLEISLVHRKYGCGEEVTSQGAMADRIHFLFSGEARVTAEPGQHKRQFGIDSPSSHHNLGRSGTVSKHQELNSISSLLGRKKTTAHGRGRKNQDSTPLPHIVDSIATRRLDGYVAAEKKSFQRVIDVCLVQDGEVLGDVEFLTGVSAYLFTVKCAAECVFFSVSFKTMDRLGTKKNPMTLDLMRWAAEIKLQSRVATELGKKVPIISMLLFRLREGDTRRKNGHGGKTEDGTSRKTTPFLPSQRAQMKQIKELFLQNKGPLLQPLTEGAVYYRQLSQKRAKLRKVEREQNQREVFFDFPCLERQLVDAKLDKNRAVRDFDQKRNMLWSKRHVDTVNAFRWKI